MDDPGSWNSQVSRNCTSSLSLHIIHMEFKMSLTIYILRVNLFIEKKSYPDFAFNGVTCKRLLTVYSEKSTVGLFFWTSYRTMTIMRISHLCSLRALVFILY